MLDPLLHALKGLSQPDLRPGYVRAFHQAVFDAIKDGKLTEEEIRMLEIKREELGLSREILDMIKRDVYVSALQHVIHDTQISENEWEEMEQIQDYLGISDKEIFKTKGELLKLRILSEIRRGNLPIFPEEGFIPQKRGIIALVRVRPCPCGSQ